MNKIEKKLTRDEGIDKQLNDINYMLVSFTQGLMSKKELDEFIKLCLNTAWYKGAMEGYNKAEAMSKKYEIALSSENITNKQLN